MCSFFIDAVAFHLRNCFLHVKVLHFNVLTFSYKHDILAESSKYIMS